MQGGAKGQAMASDDLREIFTFRDDCISDTHDTLNCRRCRYIPSDGVRPSHEPESEEDSDDSSDSSDDSDSDDSDDSDESVDSQTKKQKKQKTTTKKRKKKKKKQKRRKGTSDASADGGGGGGAGDGGGGGGDGEGEQLTQLQRSAQVGNPSEDEIALWAHHAQKDTILDDVLRNSDRNNNISFVFELRVPPMVVPVK